MLQFWKKSGSKEKNKSTTLVSPVRHVQSEEACVATNGSLPKSCTVEKLLAQLCEEAESIQPWEQVVPCRSRLSMSVAEVFADKEALAYLIQFMEARGVGPLIRFWLDVECFRSAATTELCNASRSKCHLAKRGRNSSPSDISCMSDHDSAFESQYSEPSQVQVNDKRIKEVNDSSAESAHSSPEHKSEHYTTPVCNVKKDHWTETEEEQDLHVRYDSEGGDRHSVNSVNSASVWNDAVRIFEKYLALNAPHPVKIGGEATSAIAQAITSEADVDPDCFRPVQTLCYEIMENEHFNEFLRSEYYCKHQIDVLTSGEVSLTDVLYNQTSLFYFMEFMEQECQQSLVEFWLAATNFQSNILESGDRQNPNPDELESDAIVLYERYFSLQATCPLGFGDKVRIEIEHNICREGGPSATCFQKPLLIIMRVLEKNYLQAFLQSQLYVKYLSELMNTIQACPSLASLVTRHRKTGSDCSSDTCVSTHNTLLASSDLALQRKISRNEDRNMSVDSKQLYDPDSLWSRREHSGLSFGRINELGRFETEVEPEPERKNESRFTKAMKKLVNMEEDKAKEEMAWQIAAMIVKDVTSVTLSEPSLSS